MSTPTQIEGNLEDYSFSRDGNNIVITETANLTNTYTTGGTSQIEFSGGDNVSASDSGSSRANCRVGARGSQAI